MQAELVSAGDDPSALAAQLRALIPSGGSVAIAVAEIVEDVRAGGDAAVKRYTERFDTAGAPAPTLRVTQEALEAAAGSLSAEVLGGIEAAARNVLRVAAAGVHSEQLIDFDTHTVTVRETAVKSAAVYVPGGRAPYPSTVVMGVVTARAAGVERVAVCSPPGPDGTVHAAILAAAALTGADEVYRVGGAQAIAACAYGTETIAPVDVIVGPGNLYVQEAKRQVSGQVGIDSFAGPSDLCVIAEPGTDVEAVALDLLAQAEHGPATLVIALSTSAPLLAEVRERVGSRLAESAAICRLVQVPTLDYAYRLAEAFAPEHLELLGAGAEDLAPQITRSGCVFVGTGTAFGDYIAGSNHTLPTGGAARFASALGAQHFRRTMAEVRVRDHGPLTRAAVPLAQIEGFALHAQSMQARIEENQTS